MSQPERIRQSNYERYRANQRFEEMTDIAERLGYPINTTIRYEMQGGVAYCRSDTKDRPFHEQTALAKYEGRTKFVGSQAFEYTRLSHEHDEALLLDRFGSGQLSGNVLIKFSKVPDAVAGGVTDISGYRRDLLRSFVRIYYLTPDGVDCNLFTLDKNSPRGMAAAGELLGIDTTGQSEDVLAAHSLLTVPGLPEEFVEDLTAATIAAYDQEVYGETGQRTYAGSAYTDKKNAMEVISDHSKFITEHTGAIEAIMGQIVDSGHREDLLERQRQLTAAAIKLADGGTVVGSSSDASVSAEVATNDYGRECATTSGMNQAQTMENKWTNGQCRACFKETQVGSCHVCAACAAADDRGIDLLKLREKNLRRREKLQRLTPANADRIHTKNTLNQPVQQRKDIIRKQYGEYAIVTTQVVIGGTKQMVRDRRTNQLLS